MAFTLTSPTIRDGHPIPPEHARNGRNLSPQLDWTDPPLNTLGFVLVMEDPDVTAPGFRYYWAVFDIPKDRRHLPAGRSSKARTEALPHGLNDFGHPYYDGPEPPSGERPHTYRFRLAAVDTAKLPVGHHLHAGEIWDAAREHLLAETELTGTYAST
jgi:Raf kinase inhibitor-like YbhB/YbcL family protein